MLLGPTGTGKTLHGRQMANRLDVIHVSFTQILQDMMFKKLGRNIGGQFSDEKDIPKKVMPE